MPNVDHKLKLLYLMDYFKDYSDQEHPVSMPQILDYLEKRMGHRPDRKSIYDDINSLEEYGFHIHKEPSGKNYYLEEREFSFNEVKTIVDCVAASKFLTTKQASRIIEKCKTLTPDWNRYRLMRQVFVQNRARTDNDEAKDESEKIFEAIQKKKQVSFSYFDYDLAKHRKYRYNGDLKIVSPWAMLYDNNFYYLLAYDADDSKIKNYRVDHIEGAEVEEADVIGEEEFKKINLEEYTKQTFGMFGGEVVPVTMCFHIKMISTVLDKFGRGVVLRRVDDEHFRITVPVAASPQFYAWVFGLEDLVTIEGPDKVADGMKKMLKSVAKRYNKEMV